MLRIVFMGTPGFAVPSLEVIASAHQIVGVYTQPDRPVGRGLELASSHVKKKAMELGLPVFQPVRLSAPGEFEKLAGLKPDVIVVVAFGQILKQEVLSLPRLGCVNVHSSLLPRWRGAAPIQWAILAGDRETGVTTQKMALKLDSGEILSQARTPVAPDETASSLHDRLALMGAKLIEETLAGLVSAGLVGQAQDETQVTLAHKLTKEMERLDPNKSAVELDRQIRAMNPWPGTSVTVVSSGLVGASSESAPQRLRVKKAVLRPEVKGEVGRIFERAGMVVLGTSAGCLELQRLQWDGKKEVDPGAFLNGLRGKLQEIDFRVI
ncbi:methionyl-tRNA formyltransferase [Bdellovibrionota bacterium FG-2]